MEILICSIWCINKFFSSSFIFHMYLFFLFKSLSFILKISIEWSQKEMVNQLNLKTKSKTNDTIKEIKRSNPNSNESIVIIVRFRSFLCKNFRTQDLCVTNPNKWTGFLFFFQPFWAKTYSISFQLLEKSQTVFYSL